MRISVCERRGSNDVNLRATVRNYILRFRTVTRKFASLLPRRSQTIIRMQLSEFTKCNFGQLRAISFVDASTTTHFEKHSEIDSEKHP